MRFFRSLLLFFITVASLSSCLRLPDDPVEQLDRPPLIVTGSNIEDLQENVPRDVHIQLSFNQPLDPLSLEQTDISIESGELTVRGRTKYDLLRRTLTFEPSTNLRGNLWYKFVLKNTPYSIMGTASRQEEINMLFRTGEDLSGEDPPAPAPVDFEAEIYPVFTANCICHSQVNPLLDVQLIYNTPEEFLHGAVATDSKEWQNWQIISPGSHEKSYLMYKLLGDERLGLPAITGERMPPPPVPALAEAAIETVRNWIEQGAGSGVVEPEP
jgi:hypothetical protein